jgi:hypothetical protein
MTNGKPMIFEALKETDAGWIVRPRWADKGGEFELLRSLVREARTRPEIEREYVRRRDAMDRTNIAEQFEMLKWCLNNGRDDLASSHARALRETRNAWNLAVVMQAALVGMPRSEIPVRGAPERQKAILQAIFRTVVRSRRTQHVASIGYQVLAFDLASGRVPAHSADVREYLDVLYGFAEAATKARTAYEKALEQARSWVTCPKCRGKGTKRGRYIGRNTSEGLGEVLSDGRALEIREGFEIVECNRCEGRGKVFQVKELAQGPAGVKDALSPKLWQELQEATDRYLDARIPQELTSATIPER